MRQKESLIQYLMNFVTDQKHDRILSVLEKRTRHITLILENIYQPHNASAVLRSSECFGIQDIHIIEKDFKYRPNKDIVLGSAQWLSLYKHTETTSCLEELKRSGYQIAAMTLNEKSIPIEELSLLKKTALCFGTEEKGLSDAAHEYADVHVKIPMYGFTQSFNISVSAALSLYLLRKKLEQENIEWHLNEEEKFDLMIEWLIKIIPRGEQVKEQFYSRKIGVYNNEK